MPTSDLSRHWKESMRREEGSEGERGRENESEKEGEM